jgi:hypothetical protein
MLKFLFCTRQLRCPTCHGPIIGEDLCSLSSTQEAESWKWYDSHQHLWETFDVHQPIIETAFEVRGGFFFFLNL